jgi:hypothetical protein
MMAGVSRASCSNIGLLASGFPKSEKIPWDCLTAGCASLLGVRELLRRIVERGRARGGWNKSDDGCFDRHGRRGRRRLMLRKMSVDPSMITIYKHYDTILRPIYMRKPRSCEIHTTMETNIKNIAFICHISSTIITIRCLYYWSYLAGSNHCCYYDRKVTQKHITYVCHS